MIDSLNFFQKIHRLRCYEAKSVKRKWYKALETETKFPTKLGNRNFMPALNFESNLTIVYFVMYGHLMPKWVIFRRTLLFMWSMTYKWINQPKLWYTQINSVSFLIIIYYEVWTTMRLITLFDDVIGTCYHIHQQFHCIYCITGSHIKYIYP
jgi:hypothetical protein